jgi:hypothetical protein
MEQAARGLSAEGVRAALDEIREFLNESVIGALAEAAHDQDLSSRVVAVPRDFLLRRELPVPQRLEVSIRNEIGNREMGLPGRTCFRFCRTVDPTPPPPDPSGIVFCVELCVPW